MFFKVRYHANVLFYNHPSKLHYSRTIQVIRITDFFSFQSSYSISSSNSHDQNTLRCCAISKEYSSLLLFFLLKIVSSEYHSQFPNFHHLFPISIITPPIFLRSLRTIIPTYLVEYFYQIVSHFKIYPIVYFNCGIAQ